jgi:hypothetical protein
MAELIVNRKSFPNQEKFRFYYTIKKYFKIIGFEAFVWISALVYLAVFSPVGQTHFTICPLSNLGFDFCPGCGLGHSITQIFHGNFIESFHTHPLGLFALIIIAYRVYTLLKTNINHYKRAEA